MNDGVARKKIIIFFRGSMNCNNEGRSIIVGKVFDVSRNVEILISLAGK